MKTDIHPHYMNAKVTCACGNSFLTRATVHELRLDICNVCHPFYTGKQKFVDTAGRVERFRARYGLEEGQETNVEKKKRAKKGKAAKDLLSASPVFLAERAAALAEKRQEDQMIKDAGERQKAKGQPVAPSESVPAAPAAGSESGES